MGFRVRVKLVGFVKDSIFGRYPDMLERSSPSKSIGLDLAVLEDKEIRTTGMRIEIFNPIFSGSKVHGVVLVDSLNTKADRIAVAIK